jgi:hypothetical protein
MNFKQKPKQAKEVKFHRKNHLIIEVATGNVVFEGKFHVKAGTFSSINAAKRHSRKLQEEHGLGCLRVVS